MTAEIVWWTRQLLLGTAGVVLLVLYFIPPGESPPQHFWSGMTFGEELPIGPEAIKLAWQGEVHSLPGMEYVILTRPLPTMEGLMDWQKYDLLMVQGVTRLTRRGSVVFLTAANWQVARWKALGISPMNLELYAIEKGFRPVGIPYSRLFWLDVGVVFGVLGCMLLSVYWNQIAAFTVQTFRWALPG